MLKRFSYLNPRVMPFYHGQVLELLKDAPHNQTELRKRARNYLKVIGAVLDSWSSTEEINSNSYMVDELLSICSLVSSAYLMVDALEVGIDTEK